MSGFGSGTGAGAGSDWGGRGRVVARGRRADAPGPWRRGVALGVGETGPSLADDSFDGARDVGGADEPALGGDHARADVVGELLIRERDAEEDFRSARGAGVGAPARGRGRRGRVLTAPRDGPAAMTSRGRRGIPWSVTRRRPRAPDAGSPRRGCALPATATCDETTRPRAADFIIPSRAPETLRVLRGARHTPRAFVDHGVAVDSELVVTGGQVPLRRRRGVPEGPRQCVPPHDASLLADPLAPRPSPRPPSPD